MISSRRDRRLMYGVSSCVDFGIGDVVYVVCSLSSSSVFGGDDIGRVVAIRYCRIVLRGLITVVST